MVRHGLVSSGLFCSVNVFYERLSRRSLYFNKGLISVYPLTCVLVFLLCCFNISAPPSVNLMSEIFLLSRALGYDTFILLIFPLGSFLGAVFTFFLFSYSQHGKGHIGGLGTSGMLYSEYHCLLLHLVPVVLLILNSYLFIIFL